MWQCAKWHYTVTITIGNYWKSDGGSLFSDHVIEASAMLHLFLANFFTTLLCHGYIPSTLRDAILLPIPKGHKNPSDSSNYRGIALASCVS